MKLQRFIFAAVMCFATAIGAGAEEKSGIKGFSGGMMVHSGYQFGGDNPYDLDISSPTFGIGGCAKIHLSKHFRTGFEGYFSTAPIRKEVQSGSHNKLFWTGLLADMYWQKGKVIPYAGATVGGGMETAFYMFEGDKHDWDIEQKSVLHKQPFFAIDPYVGMEYAVGEALRLTIKADWLFAINSDGLNRPMGPRVYFGCIFTH